MTQRSIREDDGSAKYVILGCSRGGKARNRKENVTRTRLIGKTDCRVRINAVKIDGVLQLTQS